MVHAQAWHPASHHPATCPLDHVHSSDLFIWVGFHQVYVYDKLHCIVKIVLVHILCFHLHVGGSSKLPVGNIFDRVEALQQDHFLDINLSQK